MTRSNGNNNSSEHGQAAVLIVLAMVVLLGFTALAVDGSMVYSDRRYTQNGADASSLAGGGVAAKYFMIDGVTNSNWSASSPNCNGNVANAANRALTAAKARAKDNSFTIDEDYSDNHGVQVECGVDQIKAEKAGGGEVTIFTQPYMDVRTMITHQTQTAFAHFVFSGAMQNTVTAVTRVRPQQPLAFGFAIVALNPADCGGKDGLIFSGNSATPVYGGGAFSNGCMSTNGGGSLSLTNGSAFYFDSNKPGGIGIVTSGYQKAELIDPNDRIPQDAYDIPVPACNAGNTINGSTLDGRTDLTGLVCVSGNATIHNEFGGDNVTLVFMGGKLTMNAGAGVDLTAPGKDYQGDAIPGVAIYFPTQYYGPMPSSCGNVNQEIKVNGHAGSQITGSIVAPCSDVSLEGGEETLAYNSQVIGWNVNVGGGGLLQIVFDANNIHMRPSILDLWR